MCKNVKKILFLELIFKQVYFDKIFDYIDLFAYELLAHMPNFILKFNMSRDIHIYFVKMFVPNKLFSNSNSKPLMVYIEN